MVLSSLLRQHGEMTKLDSFKEGITSEITELECRRTLDRIRLQEGFEDEEIADRLSELGLLLNSLTVIRLNAPILNRAKSPFSTVVRSLDAIHLATAELAKATTFLTFDRQQSTAARAMGFEVDARKK